MNPRALLLLLACALTFAACANKPPQTASGREERKEGDLQRLHPTRFSGRTRREYTQSPSPAGHAACNAAKWILSELLTIHHPPIALHASIRLSSAPRR